MSVLSNSEIFENYINGNIVISPYNEQQLNNTSYDVTLGKYYYKPTSSVNYINPEDEINISKHWGCHQQAMYISDSVRNLNDEYIIIPPNTTYLCHTNEFIGGKKCFTTMMKARSTMGRCKVTVCQCAGWGDVGYINRWTMEVRNQSDIPVYLRVGLAIAQIIFFRTSEKAFDYTEKGKYQSSKDINEIIEKWEPSHMLPRSLSKKVVDNEEGRYSEDYV
jgi:dCTP deaminase